MCVKAIGLGAAAVLVWMFVVRQSPDSPRCDGGGIARAAPTVPAASTVVCTELGSGKDLCAWERVAAGLPALTAEQVLEFREQGVLVGGDASTASTGHSAAANSATLPTAGLGRRGAASSARPRLVAD